MPEPKPIWQDAWIERDQIIQSDEYHIGYAEGWTHALAWAGFTDSAEAAAHRKPIRTSSAERES